MEAKNDPPPPKPVPLGLVYDDVLIVPQKSDIESRSKISLRTKFSKNIWLNIPFVSANMTTVTESRMAIAVAREGGIGVIHRFLSIEAQAAEVKKVKRAEHLVIENPICISMEATLGEALEVMAKNNVTGLLVHVVHDDPLYIIGILTARDVRFKNDLSLKVKDIMTPREKLIVGGPTTTIQEALNIFDKYKIEKLPLLNHQGHTLGLITASDFLKKSKYTRAAKDKNGKLLVAAALGVEEGTSRAEALVACGCDALVIDVAHGHHEKCLNILKVLKEKFLAVDIVAGNVATPYGAEDLIKAGADAVKVGVGPGAACQTRIIAGAGYPQFSAVQDSAAFARQYGIPIIADGGVKNSGDAAKAIGAGASTVMIGNLLAGTEESPGEYYIEDESAFKIYSGMASRDASIVRTDADAQKRIDRAPEGVSKRVPFKGEVKKILNNLIDGVQSGMSYSGAKSIDEFWDKVQFVRMTESGMKESMPRPS